MSTSSWPQRPQRIYLRTVGCAVSVDDFIGDSTISSLVAEDAAWCCLYAGWLHREPPRWHLTRRHRWFNEGAHLFASRNRIRAQAKVRGLPV